MRTQVPYLARLARQAGGQAALRPPRQVFAGDTYTPGRSRNGDGLPPRRAMKATAPSFPTAIPPSATTEEPLAPEGIMSLHSPDPGADRAGSAPGATVARTGPTFDTSAPRLPVASGVQAAAAGGPAPQPAPRVPSGARTESSPPAITAPTTPVNDGITTYAAGTSPSGRSRPGGDAAQARPPESWASPLWGTPVDLPGTLKPAPVTAETGRREVAAPPPGSIAWPAEPGAASTTGSHQGRRAKDTDVPVTPGARNTADPDPSWRPAAVRELVPTAPSTGLVPPAASAGLVPPTASTGLVPPTASAGLPAASASPSSALADPEADDPRQRSRVPGRPRVSIGTIEVTVVPPDPPAPPASEIRPPAQVVPGWSRPASLLAADAAAGWMRDGLRRWYGTAQG